MYSDMVTLQVMDTIFYEAQRQGRISFYVTSIGEEAINVASAAALTPDDLIFPQVINTQIPICTFLSSFEQNVHTRFHPLRYCFENNTSKLSFVVSSTGNREYYYGAVSPCKNLRTSVSETKLIMGKGDRCPYITDLTSTTTSPYHQR